MKAVAFASLLGLTGANFVSPGLGKCLDIERTLQDDGKTRNTIEEMMAEKEEDDTKIINVQLYTCHHQRNQDFELVDGNIKSLAVGWCLESGRTIEKALNVRLNKCTDDDKQKWDLTGYGYVKNKASGTCLDIQAEKKDDGTREKWPEIKERKTVNVQLYDCHDPEKTERVNQLWQWAPVTEGGMVGVEDKFSVGGLNLSESNGFGHGAMALSAVVGSAIMMAGVFVGLRSQRTKSPMADIEE